MAPIAPVRRFKNQNYHALKKECLEQRKVFEDPEFPASDASLFYSSPPLGKIEWRRPKVFTDLQILLDSVMSSPILLASCSPCNETGRSNSSQS